MLIGFWAIGLARDSSTILLDRNTDAALSQWGHTFIEADADNQLVDLHLWTAGPNWFAAILTLITHYPRPPNHYRNLLRSTVPALMYVTVEVHAYPGPALPAVSGARRAGRSTGLSGPLYTFEP